MDRVVVLSPLKLEDGLWDIVRRVSPRVELTLAAGREDFLRNLPQAEVVLIWPQPFDLSLAPNLKWVQLMSAGLDEFADHAIMKTDILLTTTSGIHVTPIAEYVMASILAFAHRFPLMWDLKRKREWPEQRWHSMASQELRGKTLGIVGYGSIGREIGRLGKAFGMRIIATKRRAKDKSDKGYILEGTGDPEGSQADEIFPPQKLKEMLAQCDFMAIAVPLTADTKGLLGKNELAAMKRTAYLVNISRGDVVDEAALTEALEEGVIAGAALDVFRVEPLPKDSTLWGLPNVIISPHVAGISPEYNRRALELFSQNLKRYLDGEPLLNPVDKKRGY